MSERLSIEQLRRRLAGLEALPTLCALGIAVGLVTSGVIWLFLLALEAVAGIAGRESAEEFERLGYWAALLPVGGALVLGVAMHRLAPEDRRFGVVHVMERLARHRGHMPWRAALYQFFGAVVALGTGLSGGREGPAVHLGAAASSLLGETFRLPNNSVRALIACGSAAAIAVSFNTPLAAVVFAMEVVMMEYTIASFTPVLLASVTATVAGRALDIDHLLDEPVSTTLNTLWEVPYIMLSGLVIGAVAGGFVVLLRFFQRLRIKSFWQRAAAAGVVTGALALAFPQVLGVGYDTIKDLLTDANIGWLLMLGLLAAKAVASAACVGAGLPVGVIGPTLVMGALLGGLLGLAGGGIFPDQASEPALYVMLGMAAMMAAVLQAPLAALLAVVELTGNPNVTLPAMLIIVVATLTVSQVFRQTSPFLSTLAALGIRYPPAPASQHLQRAGVAGLMAPAASAPSCFPPDSLRALLEAGAEWLVVVEKDGRRAAVVPAASLAEHLREPTDAAALDLMKIGRPTQAGTIDSRANLLEAQNALDQEDVDALCVLGRDAAVVGVLTREAVESYRQQ